MKKLMIMVLTAAISASAFAQGDALKSIMKSKDYAEASQLLKSGLSSMNAESKAKAYNKLVDLSMAKVDKEVSVMSANQLAEQFKTGKTEPVDSMGMYTALSNALNDALECDKYDNMPNEKGKVKPKFHKANQDRLWKLRVHLINAGQDAAKKNDEKSALNFYGLYVQSASAPLFAEIDKKQSPDQYLGEVARVAAVYAFQGKNIDLANKYCDVALADTASYKDALSLKMYLMQQNLKTKEDSVKCLETFEQLYAKDKNEQIFNNLASMYGSMKQYDKQMALINERIAQDPKCFTAWAFKGQAEMNESKWDEAIADFKKALEIDSKKSIILTYLGYSLNSKAAASNNPAEQNKLYTESLGYLEKARDVDPDRKEANWTYPLYQCYYALKGANAPETKELESLIK